MLFSELCVLQIDVVIKSRIFHFVCNLVNNIDTICNVIYTPYVTTDHDYY